MAARDKDLKDLQSIWYKKLKDNGFNDIEDTSTEGRLLKSWHSFRYKEDEEKTVYYEKAHDILNSHHFKKEEYRAIWEMHCEGLSEREISERLKSFKKSWVHTIIARTAKLIK